MIAQRAGLPPEHPVASGQRARLGLVLSHVDTRCAEVPYLAGAALSAADIMSVFSLTTMRLYFAFDLAPWPNILAWLQRIGQREAYRRALQKGDPGFEPMLGPQA
jgi:glutathione S-transferase